MVECGTLMQYVRSRGCGFGCLYAWTRGSIQDVSRNWFMSRVDVGWFVGLFLFGLWSRLTLQSRQLGLRSGLLVAEHSQLLVAYSEPLFWEPFVPFITG